MPVETDRESLARDLRSYGEDALAAEVSALGDATLERIFDRADHYLYSDSTRLLAHALARAAVEVLEGSARPLSRKRRKLKGVYPERDEDALRVAVPTGRSEGTTLGELVGLVAARKRLGGLVRRRGQSAEKPADVFAQAVDTIAARFEREGWRYARSGPHLTRRHGPFTLRISFGSSASNAAGAVVVLDVYAGVRSQQLKKWRASQGSPPLAHDGVATGPLGNLAPEPKWLEWNLADPSGRDSAISDVVAQIEELALPWFELFTDTTRLVAALDRGPVRNFQRDQAVEVLVWMGHRDVAERHLRACLAEESIADSFRRERELLTDREPTPDTPHGDLGEELARIAVAHGLWP